MEVPQINSSRREYLSPHLFCHIERLETRPVRHPEVHIKLAEDEPETV
jgi:hypothetical protein